jgi:hypothetical protein
VTNTTTEILTVNGVVLNTLAKNVESLAGRLRTPAFRTENIVVPGRHGALRTPNKKFDQNVIQLPMWVIGCDDNGQIPSDSNARIEFYARVDELSRLFKGSIDELDIRHTLPDGSIRQIFGDAMDVFDWTTTAAPTGLFAVNILAYYPMWQDIKISTLELAAAGATASFNSKFGNATAPMEAMAYKLTGPWLNPVLTFADGSWVAYDVNLLAGQTVTIDSGTWTLTGGGGHVVDYTKIRHDGGDDRWATLPPTSQIITLGGSNRTVATKLALTGRLMFLVG